MSEDLSNDLLYSGDLVVSEHLLNNSLGGSPGLEGMCHLSRDADPVDSSKVSSSAALNTVEDVSDRSKDVSSGVDHSAVVSHHVSIMVSDEASFSQNMEHLVNHDLMVSSGVVDDGVELMDELVVSNGSVHAGHVKGGFEVTF